jgi:peroxiredoxin
VGPRLAILLGLLAGVIVGGVLLAAYVVAGPRPVPPASPAASTPVVVSSPPASSSPAPSTSGSPSGSASASASGSAGASPSASAPDPASPGSPDDLATPAADDLSAAFHIGEPAPALKLTALSGDDIELRALKGKPVWVVFMATWCPSCQDEIPAMNSFALRYAENGLQVVAVDVREPRADVQAFADQLRVQFPMGLDTDGGAARDWGVVVPPIHFWIDKDGIIREGALGGIGRDIMAEALRKVLPGVDVRP